VNPRIPCPPCMVDEGGHLWELLTEDEERALATIRAARERMPNGNGTVSVDGLARLLIEGGAVDDGVRGAERRLRVGGAEFALSAGVAGDGIVEVRFDCSYP